MWAERVLEGGWIRQGWGGGQWAGLSTSRQDMSFSLCMGNTKQKDSQAGSVPPPLIPFLIKIDKADKYVFLNFGGFSLSFVLFFHFLKELLIRVVRQRLFWLRGTIYIYICVNKFNNFQFLLPPKNSQSLESVLYRA